MYYVEQNKGHSHMNLSLGHLHKCCFGLVPEFIDAYALPLCLLKYAVALLKTMAVVFLKQTSS